MYSGGTCTERLKCHLPQILPFLHRTLYPTSQYHSHRVIYLLLLLLALPPSQKCSHINVLNWSNFFFSLVDFAKLFHHLHDSFYICIENISFLMLTLSKTPRQLFEEDISTVQSAALFMI